MRFVDQPIEILHRTDRWVNFIKIQGIQPMITDTALTGSENL
jgi:hypothetical protein